MDKETVHPKKRIAKGDITYTLKRWFVRDGTGVGAVGSLRGGLCTGCGVRLQLS